MTQFNHYYHINKLHNTINSIRHRQHNKVIRINHVQSYSFSSAAAPVETTPDDTDTTHKFTGGVSNESTSNDETIKQSTNDNSKQNITPSQLVDLLNEYIIGQYDAKKSVAVALRNRWRRHQLDSNIRNEITPKNILLTGPTGCGKTEIARRLASITNSPFIKVEATKFTEVGFYGKDVDSIIKDLTRIAVNLIKQQKKNEMKSAVQDDINDIILDSLCGKSMNNEQKLMKRNELLSGKLEHEFIEIDVPVRSVDSTTSATSTSADKSSDMAAQFFSQINKLAQAGKSTERKSMKISDARDILLDMLVSKKLNQDDINRDAIKAVENDGIVFLDEIDKICTSSDARHYSSSADASAEGVQRDLLPLVEGTTISTTYGNVNTDHILFICSGAFHSVKPSDMLPELQGRLPIRVALNMLTENDLYDILTKPKNNLIVQNIELLKTESIELVITDDAIHEIARVAYEVNKSIENIGARRLYTLTSKVMDEYAYSAADIEPGTKLVIDKQYVIDKVHSMMKKSDLNRYIL